MMDETKTILVIEDDGRMRAGIEQMLKECTNYHVLAASNGLEGLQKAGQMHPDLVLLDIMMPDVDGWQVCRRLRETSGVPIIVLTARTGEGNSARAFELGANDYVTKPFDPQMLLARIQAHFCPTPD